MIMHEIEVAVNKNGHMAYPGRDGGYWMPGGTLRWEKPALLGSGYQFHKVQVPGYTDPLTEAQRLIEQIIQRLDDDMEGVALTIAQGALCEAIDHIQEARNA